MKKCGCGKTFKSGQALGGHRRGNFSCGYLIERAARVGIGHAKKRRRRHHNKIS